MEKTRFHAGIENLKKIDGKGGEAVIQSLETISPHPIYWLPQSPECRLCGKNDI